MALLARGLKSKGVMVHVFILNWYGFTANKNDLVKFDCPTYYLFDNKYFSLLSEIIFMRYIKKYDYDILLINGAQRNIDLAIKSKRYIKNIFIAIRNLRFIHDSYFNNAVLRIINNNMKIICNSKSISNSLQLTFKLNKKMIKVINNGIIKFRYISKKKMLSGFKVMFVGNLREVKNPLFFLNVAKKIIEDKKFPMSFYLIGDGPLINDIMSFIEKYNLNNQVKVLGKIANNEIPFEEIDLVFNSSESEGSSNSILESLMFGKPVVACDNDGNKEILNKGKFGELYKKNNINSAVKKIEYYYKLDSKSLTNISINSKTFIKNYYNKELMVNEYFKYFKDSM